MTTVQNGTLNEKAVTKIKHDKNLNKYTRIILKTNIRYIQLAHQLMHIYNFFYIKTFKIAPTRFDPKIIFRELHCSLLKSHF